MDYSPVEGTLEFKHTEGKKEIVIPILRHDNAPAGGERDELFGVQLYDPEPAIVKISKRNTLLVEIVTDAQKAKQA